jgi:hypothetical protein
MSWSCVLYWSAGTSSLHVTCRIVCDGIDAEDSRLLGFYTVSSCKCQSQTSFSLLFPEDGGTTILRSVGKYDPSDSGISDTT